MVQLTKKETYEHIQGLFKVISRGVQLPYSFIIWDNLYDLLNSSSLINTWEEKNKAERNLKVSSGEINPVPWQKYVNRSNL